MRMRARSLRRPIESAKIVVAAAVAPATGIETRVDQSKSYPLTAFTIFAAESDRLSVAITFKLESLRTNFAGYQCGSE